MQQELAQALSELKNLPLDTAKEINAWVDVFIRRCTQVIEKNGPQKQAQRKIQAWMVKGVHRGSGPGETSGKKILRKSNPLTWIDFAKARNQKKNTIRKYGRMGFREQVEKAVSTGSAWKLAKWARRQAGEVIETPQIPTLIRDNTISMDNVQKAELLAEKFFPTLPEIDLTDMESSRSRPTFEVSSEIIEEDVKAQIKRTAPDKAPGHDKIPNRFWKLMADVVSEYLAKLFSKCLEAGVCPAHFKKSITVVLRKERKENYQAINSY